MSVFVHHRTLLETFTKAVDAFNNQNFKVLEGLLHPHAVLNRIHNRKHTDWHTRIGTIPEYLAAAEEAGLQPGVLKDISHRTVHFWTTTQALIQAEAQDHELSPAEAVRRQASLRAHALVRQGLITNGLRYAIMSFGKRQ